MYNRAIRGAITVDNNSENLIISTTKQLLEEMIEQNNIITQDIISIIFTATEDLDKAYPAVAARQIGIVNAGLLCMQEMKVDGSLKMCIRILLNVNTSKDQNVIKHVYLKGATKLRPDLINSSL